MSTIKRRLHKQCDHELHGFSGSGLLCLVMMRQKCLVMMRPKTEVFSDETEDRSV